MSHTSPTAPATLVALQEWFSDAVRSIDPNDTERLTQEASRFLTGTKTFNQKERLTVYMSDYWPRCLDNLEEDFPLLKNYLGDTLFFEAMTQYVKTHPPYAFTLLFIGRHLSEFFSYYPHGKDADLIRDIIQFEWAKIESFAASNAPSFNPETLTPEQTAQLPTFPLTLHPSVQILNLTFPVHRANFTKKKATTLIIYRKEYSINFLPIHPLFGKFLTSFYTPCSISDTIDTLLLSSTKKDIYILETSLQTWLNEAVQEEWFKSPHLKGEKNDPQSLMRAAIEPNL